MVDYADDIINQVPCDPLMPACPATPSGILGSVRGRWAGAGTGGVGAVGCAVGRLPPLHPAVDPRHGVPASMDRTMPGASPCRPRRCHLMPCCQVGVKGTATDQGNVTSWPYGTVGGELVFLPEDLPQAREPLPCAVSDEPPLWIGCPAALWACSCAAGSCASGRRGGGAPTVAPLLAACRTQPRGHRWTACRSAGLSPTSRPPTPAGVQRCTSRSEAAGGLGSCCACQQSGVQQHGGTSTHLSGPPLPPPPPPFFSPPPAPTIPPLLCLCVQLHVLPVLLLCQPR